MDLPPGDNRLTVKVGREFRPYRVHVPKQLRGRLAVVALDGVTLLNAEGNMGRVNGVDDAADTHGFVAVHPIPKTRYLGILAGWNTPGGFLSFRSDYDDVDYVSEILRALHLDRAFLVGFSAGGQFAHILAGRLAGTIAGVVSVSGTWLGTEPSLPPGTAAWIIHGENDPVLPYTGGVGSLKTKLLVALGNRNILLSHPDRQARAYALANGYGELPLVEEEHKDRIYMKRSFGPTGGVAVVEYFVRYPHGGHTYHGRKTGKGTESLISGGHGRPLTAQIFSINVHILGSLESVMTIPEASR